MRWFVEITAFGHGPAPSVTRCIDAPGWQPALQKARASRGDTGPLDNFSIDLLEDCYRALDAISLVQYLITQASDDEPETPEEAAPRQEYASEGAALLAPEPAATSQPKRRAETLMFASSGMAAVREDPPAPAPTAARPSTPEPVPLPITAQPLSSVFSPVFTPPPVPVIAPFFSPVISPADLSPLQPREGVSLPARAAALPVFELISQREENPTERSPLTYREYVYAVAEGTPESDVTELLLTQFEEARTAIEPGTSGTFINLAVFDHIFQGKPRSRPIATLTWKDWKGPEPDIRYPAREAAPPLPTAEAPTRSSRPPPISDSYLASQRPAAQVQIVGAPGSSPLSPRIGVAPVIAPASSPPPSASTIPSAPPPSSPAAPSSRPPSDPARRLSGDDLIAALSDACGDLQFLRDPLEGADFILELTLEKLPSEVGFVSLFDINEREYVVVRQTGGTRSAVLTRAPERDLLAQAAVRANRAVVLPDASGDPRASVDRFTAAGIQPRSLLCAPVQVGGRYLGLIEVINPEDGRRFTESDGNALTYIGEQFAEFLAARELIIDPSRIGQEAFKERGR